LQLDGGPAEQFLQLLQQELNKVRTHMGHPGLCWEVLLVGVYVCVCGGVPHVDGFTAERCSSHQITRECMVLGPKHQALDVTARSLSRVFKRPSPSRQLDHALYSALYQQQASCIHMLLFHFAGP
jgi:hypothetical protein